MILSKQESKRSIRIFVSSTFKDMVAERDELMSHCWPELRRFCKERYLELIEVDLRWGISEEQDKRNETLKLCLNEIHECRPFFIGLLGERYGWIPDKEVYNPDILEEQSWLRDLKDRSVTELEIMHGVLNNPNLTGRAFFYFRDPNYIKGKGQEFISENEEAENKQKALKEKIKSCCRRHSILLKENYSNPKQLALDILEDLKLAIEKAYPLELVPDSLTRESLEHEAFAESRRKTYIGRQSYFDRLDKHVTEEGTPLVITGESGIGKSALLANWTKHWKEAHGDDFIFQHYIGGTTKSGDHWALMNRLMSEIKRWTDDHSELPIKHDDILRDFRSWLVRLRLNAEQKKVRAVLILDTLNQLEDKDYAHMLSWLPEYPFFGPLRLVVSTLDGPILGVLKNRNWETFEIKPLQSTERKELIREYLKRFSKELEEKYLTLIASFTATENPLYLKIFLDELRVTGTFDRLSEKISYYLSAPDIPSLLDIILNRYETEYENERKGIVADTLGLIFAARRGLFESELLELLKPNNRPHLPQAIWSPIRSVLDEFLISKNGILNFSHTYIKEAVERRYVPDMDAKDKFQLNLVDFFQKKEVNERSCDELPWLLVELKRWVQLITVLRNIQYFVVISTEFEQLNIIKYLTKLNKIGFQLKEIFFDVNRLWDNRLNDRSKYLNSIKTLGGYLIDFGYPELAIKFGKFVLGESVLAQPIDLENERNFIGLVAVGLNLTGDQSAALKILRDFSIKVKSINHNSEIVIDADVDYAISLIYSGQPILGRSILDESLKQSIRCFGGNSDRTITVAVNLCLAMMACRDPDTVFFMYRILELIKTVKGEINYEYKNILNNIGAEELRNGNLIKAHDAYKQVLTYTELIYGENYIETIMAKYNYAGILYRLGQYHDSLFYYKNVILGFKSLPNYLTAYDRDFNGAVNSYKLVLEKLGYSQ